MTLSEHKRSPEAWFGAGAAVLFFLYNGLVPALVYGGFMGGMTGKLLFGDPIEPELLRLFMAGGGMALAVLAMLFLFLVLGAALGTLLGVLYRKLQRLQDASHPTQHPDP